MFGSGFLEHNGDRKVRDSFRYDDRLPHGLRKQEGAADHLGLNKSVNAVCFPAACATASSFDVELMERMGQILGDECQAENVSMLLGAAVNIKRSPLRKEF